MPKKKTLRVQRRTTRGLRLYWRLARKNAWTASPTCRAAAIALIIPMRRLKFVPRKMARGAKGRKPGRHFSGQMNDANVR